MSALATIATIATLLTGSPCAVIDNGPNAVAWTAPIGTEYHVYTAHYTDYGDNLGYDAPLHRAARPAIRAAEAALRQGKPGHKVRLACG